MRRNILIVLFLATLVFIGSASFAVSMNSNTSNTAHNNITAHSFNGIWAFDSSLVFADPAGDGEINGTVTDAATHVAIPGATVEIGALKMATDSEGHYAITIAPGNYTVMASKLDYASQSKPANIIANLTVTVNFELTKTEQGMGWIAGIVTDKNTSMPIGAANVSANHFSATTNATGQYKMQVTAMKTYNVTAEKTGYMEKIVANVTVPTNQTISVNFELTRTVTPPPSTKGWIAGTVRDANSSMPLQGAMVSANGFSAVTNSSGHYRMEVTAPKTYSVMAQKTGYISKTVMNVTVAVNQTATANFNLTRSSTPPPSKTVEVKIKIEPKALNLKSHGKWITVEIQFPKNVSVADINMSSIRLNGTIPVAANAPTHTNDNKLIVKFDRQAVQDLILSKGQTAKHARVTLTVTGDLKGETTFSGSQTIKTILPNPKPSHEKRGKP